MPGSVSIQEARGQAVNAGPVDFTMCIIGYSSSSAVSSGQLSPLYGSPIAAATDLGIGDAVDALCQAIAKTPGNPTPPAAAFYTTPATTPGVRGATLTVSGVTGTSVVTKTASTHPKGTYQPIGRVRVGGTIGVAGITIEYSVDNGRTFMPAQALGTGTSQAPLIGGVDAGISYDFAAGTLVAGDTWSESLTTPPIWADSDLYAAGPPATGAFASIGASSTQFGMIVITEPVASGDFATLVTGLNALGAFGKKPLLIIRFRDPGIAETDSAYILAAQAFGAQAVRSDDRICGVYGSLWLTDAYRGFVYLRSGLPAVLARLQSFIGRPQERLAHHPGFVGDGPLEGASLTDYAGNPIGHDEQVRGGIDPFGLTFYRIPNPDLPGVYVSQAPVMFPAGGAILTEMDRRVVSAMERRASAIAWTMIQGAQVWDPATFALAPDLQDAAAQRIRTVLAKDFAREIQNPDDGNLVQINPTVVVSGAQVTLSGVINVRLFGYANTINLTFAATR